jgi:hypothetical protein
MGGKAGEAWLQGCRWALALVMIGGCYEGGGRTTGELSSDGNDTDDDHGDTDADDDGLEAAVGPTGLRLLTPTQYANSIVDVLGDVAAQPVGQWRSSIAAAQGGVSPAGVENYEHAAFEITAQIFEDPARRMAVADCVPSVASDDPCIGAVIESLGRRAWRRPLSEDEIARYQQVAVDVAELLDGDPWVGLQHAVAGLLQSPNFVYRVELGTPLPDDPSHVRLDAYELASRASYFIWNTTPDDALLDAAQAGELDDDTGLEAQVERLMSSPRARSGIVQLFVDSFDLDALLTLQKNQELLPAFSSTIGAAMREELAHVIGDTVIDQGDVRRLFDTRTGYVDAELAALYGVDPPLGSEPAAVSLPPERSGLLTLAGFLAIHSGDASTSPTHRGLTIRQAVMCQTVPPPPPDVEPALPEPTDDEGHITKREQLEVHATNPACAACHALIDPIGLALEHYDAIGGYRATDQGLTIDPSGELDGHQFADAVELGSILADHDAVPYCITVSLYRYALGHVEQPDQYDTIQELLRVLTESGYDLRAAIEALVTSESFRYGLMPQEGSP